MYINKAYSIKFAGLLFFVSFLLTACFDNGTSDEWKQHLYLQASENNVREGDQVSFEVMANGGPIDADIYIDSTRIDSSVYTFDEAGDYNVIAKKEGYHNSQETIIHVMALVKSTANAIFISEGDIYVARSMASTIPPSRPTPVYRDTVIYWKNQNPHKLTDNGQAYSITVSDGKVYVAGSHGDTAAYWKNGTFHYMGGKWNRSYLYLCIQRRCVYNRLLLISDESFRFWLLEKREFS